MLGSGDPGKGRRQPREGWRIVAEAFEGAVYFNPTLTFSKCRCLEKVSSSLSHSFLISEKGMLVFICTLVPTE